MSRIFGRIILTLCCTFLLATAAQARTLKEVYLRDGGRIECQNVWQADGKVMVLVNRDTLLDLPKSDVDLKKTFARKPAKAARKRMPAVKAPSEPTAAKTVAAAAPPAKSEVAPAAEQKPASPPKPAEKIAPPAAKPEQAAPTKPAETIAPPATEQQAEPAASTPPVRTNLPVANPNPLPENMLLTQMIGMGITSIVISLLLLLLLIVSLCMVFAKAGEAWWKALIPIYNIFVFVIIAGKPWWWGLLLLIPLVNIVVSFIINIALARRFGEGIAFGLGLSLVGFVFFPLLAFGKYEYR